MANPNQEQNESPIPPAVREAADLPMHAGDDDAIETRVWAALARVVDPELHYNIVDLGLVYGVDVRQGAVNVQMTLTSPGCPYGPYLIHEVRTAVRGVDGVRSETFQLVWEPSWTPGMMSEEARLELGFDV